VTSPLGDDGCRWETHTAAEVYNSSRNEPPATDELLTFGNRRDVVARPSSIIVRKVVGGRESCSNFSAIVWRLTAPKNLVFHFGTNIITRKSESTYYVPESSETTTVTNVTIAVINADCRLSMVIIYVYYLLRHTDQTVVVGQRKHVSEMRFTIYQLCCH